MGCSLCTIQQSDEHYKLLQGIYQVNGRNLSLATHDQAVEALQTAKDPIEVQVLRRTAHNKTFKTLTPAQVVDNSTQTNITLKYLTHLEAIGKLPSPPTQLGLAMLDNIILPTVSQIVSDYPYPPDFYEGIQKDIESRGLEYEEVDLQRITTEKLSLALCCKTDNEKTPNYVSKIDPKGIAAKDGRNQEGDKIIQINGEDIQRHEAAVTLMTRMKSKNVNLAVARPETQDNGWLEDRNKFLDDLKIDMLEQQHYQPMHFTANMLQQSRHEDEGTTDTATVLSNHHEKDSGMGHTDESTRNDESSEQEILGNDQTSACDTLPGNHKFNYSQETVGSGDMHLSNDSFLSVDNGESGNFHGISDMACEHFRKLLELKCLVNGNSPCGFLEHDTRLYEGDSLDCDEQEIQMLNEELLNIELECLSIIQAHRLQTEVEGKQPINDSNKMHFTEQTSSDKVHQDLINKQMEKDSSSAYHTVERCWSIPPALEISPDTQSTATEDRDGHTYSKHALSPIQETSPTKKQPSLEDSEVTNVGKRKQSEKRNPRKSLLTSSHHSPFKLQNIPVHAQHYQSYMQLIQQKSSVEYAQSQVSLASLYKNPETCPTDSRPKMEWKVKIRSDGTQHIAKRPSKDQMLKERALRIREERCSITTDDDAASEMKVGRYWTKEKRKQHAARAKEQRQWREFLKKGRSESKEQAGALDDKKEPDIIQLSHKKMMKKRNKRIFDNWMTIQELLTHGAKSTDETRLCNSFLSVTTV
ncbi:E3 ubiquitin-protein ligase PDZRN3 isoform X1 [Xyrauchen texanus]|uniref:E3 ubiquitin-protein ligase PDZRN3 isoform X1 n=1 Tax=Xyrauchen texanus TaxID=154827 RepID=UPI0022420E40|nr:E3 ubiquitin-protein ligase PDZRN3 isoform X1 [Xyrauchen texanus]